MPTIKPPDLADKAPLEQLFTAVIDALTAAAQRPRQGWKVRYHDVELKMALKFILGADGSVIPWGDMDEPAEKLSTFPLTITGPDE